jgi:queuosine precursor transporter
MKYWPLAAYIATIFCANWAIATFGLVPVGFGLLAPAGVYFAGLAFTFRDLTQDQLGRRWTYLAIIVGAALSGLVSGPLALASGTAFLVSETADLLVYTPLKERHWLAAVGASNVVGLIIDSALFLFLAFGSLEFLAGQVVGKFEMTILAVAALWAYREILARHTQGPLAQPH